MRFVIITGLSGAGKSQAVNILEDAGYYCVDNLPPSFITKFAELCFSSQGKLSNVAIVCDIRGGEMFGELAKSIYELKLKGFKYEILFLEANDETLIKRYKESRRKHPLSVTEERLSEAIARERKMLQEIKLSATHIIDTSATTRQQFRSQIMQIYSENETNHGIVINVMSFGFKYGIPLDADLVFDVRFLPNPYYILELREKSGLNDEVADYVMNFKQSQEFKKKLFDMIDYLIPHYIEEGKSQIVISIGCTGGMHRSVTFARYLADHLKENSYRVYTTHRDYKGNS